MKLALNADVSPARLLLDERQTFLDSPADSAKTFDAASFTPESFKVPIKVIMIGDTMLRNCKGSEADCLIDLASPAALDAVSKDFKASLPVGTYSQGSFSLCKPEGDAGTKHLYIKGSVTIKGVKYYTSSKSVLTKDASDYGETKLGISTCGIVLKFATPFKVEDGKTVNITLFSLIQGVVSASTNTEYLKDDNCVNGGEGRLCTNYPALVPYVGDTKASVESYLFHKADTSVATASGLLHLVFNEKGDVFGGTTFGYATETADIRGFGFDKAFGQLVIKSSKNSDGTFKLETTGGNPQQDACGSFNAESFARTELDEVGSGKMSRCPNGKLSDAELFDYETLRIPSTAIGSSTEAVGAVPTPSPTPVAGQ